MSIAPTTIGPYTVTRELGRGGMGVVYLARDARLDRDVAIKALPEHLSSDPDRLARFQREARALASLNHPAIGAIYGVEDCGGKQYLVLEYIEGETLDARLERGPLPVDEALDICAQIAAGVEAAHEAGVIHRDLKPGNVIVTPEGKAKVLDFGLARMEDTSGSSGAMSKSPTRTSPAIRHSPTIPGTILGTAAYMSPEQARGRSVDKRTDIWSFGVALFESLTGASPFVGETVSDSIGAILHKDVDLHRLPPDTPPTVKLLLHRCLVKDRNKRLRDIGDARLELESALADPATSGALLAGSVLADAPARRRVIGSVAAVVAITAVVGALLGYSIRGPQRESAAMPVVRFSIHFPESDGVSFAADDEASLAIDRTGTVLAYTGYQDHTRRIFVRPLGSAGARPVPGADGGRVPFFSPDSRWLGFLADNKIMKAPVAGGPPVTICEAATRSVTWLDDGSILFNVNQGESIHRVHEGGGTPQMLAMSDRKGRTPGREQLVLGFDSLHAVPGAPYVLAAVWDGVTIEDYDIVTVALDDGAVRQIVPNANHPQFVAPDRLVFHREGSLFSVPFDPKRGQITGDPRLVLREVRTAPWADVAQAAVAADGALVYAPGGRQGPGRRLIRVDETGRSEPLMDAPDAIIGGIRVSPDGGAVALMTLRRKIELWAFDLRRRSFTLVNGVGEMYSPVWIPGGDELVYQRLSLESPHTIVRQRVHAADQPRTIATDDAPNLYPSSVSPDGNVLLLTHENAANQQGDNIVLMRLDEEAPPQPLVATAANESGPKFSPDGRWFAYQSNETGRSQVYIRAFPDTGRRWQVSTEGGAAPHWSPSGDKLYFLHRDAMHAAPIHTEGGFVAGQPAKLFDVAGIASLDAWGAFDVLADGGFVMVQPADWERAPPRIEVVVNWAAELREE